MHAMVSSGDTAMLVNAGCTDAACVARSPRRTGSVATHACFHELCAAAAACSHMSSCAKMICRRSGVAKTALRAAAFASEAAASVRRLVCIDRGGSGERGVICARLFLWRSFRSVAVLSLKGFCYFFFQTGRRQDSRPTASPGVAAQQQAWRASRIRRWIACHRRGSCC